MKRKISTRFQTIGPIGGKVVSEEDCIIYEFLLKSIENDDFKSNKFNNYQFCYYRSLIDEKNLEEVIHSTVVKGKIPIQAVKINDQSSLGKDMLSGNCLIRNLQTKENHLLDINKVVSRSIKPPETEATIIGPQLGFNENLLENLNLIRNYLRSNSLIVKEFEVGKFASKTLYLLYINDVAEQQHITEMSERLNKLENKFLFDTHYLEQSVTERPFSIFPQLLQTERVDRVCANLLDGKIALLMEGSPFASTFPHIFLENIQSPEDYYLGWISGSFLRMMRFLAVITAVCLTASYVAVMSYHYLVIPPDLVILIAQSRAQVPFSPLVEALLMELSVELLREAGSRLPTRIGQTVGIVGGIVIGQAAVMAGLTSNILIIIVSFSMLSTLVIPSYGLANSLRIIRFPLVILAGYLGGFGVVFGLMLLMIYISRIESFGIPYFTPLMPLRRKDLKDSVIRFPLSFLQHKPSSSD